jgi:hypothetical protein
VGKRLKIQYGLQQNMSLLSKKIRDGEDYKDCDSEMLTRGSMEIKILILAMIATHK